MNVLLLTYGNESSIEIIKSVVELNEHNIWGCHYDTTNPGRAYLNKNFIVKCPNPWDNGEEFLSWLNSFVFDKCIDRVMLTNCKMLKFLYDNWESIESREVYMIPDREGLEYCLFKDKLYNILPEISPNVYSLDDIESIGWEIPLFAKPKHGSSGEGGRKGINTVDFWCSVSTRDVVTEYLPGDEYTVDCVSKPDGSLVDWNVRERSRVRDGITSYGRSVPEKWEELGMLIKVVAEKLKLPYFWFAQFKLDNDGVPKLLEVNCRISGSFCITKSSRKDYIKLVMSDYDMYTIVTGGVSGTSIARHMNVLPIGRKSWVWDIDGTICIESFGNYQDCAPIKSAIDILNALHDRGDEIILHTARGMKRFNNDVALVYTNLYELTRNQLSEWGVKYDKLIMGKPAGIPVDTDGVIPAELVGYVEKSQD